VLIAPLARAISHSFLAHLASCAVGTAVKLIVANNLVFENPPKMAFEPIGFLFL